MAWLLAAAEGYAVKLVNPGGVEVWKWSGGNGGARRPCGPLRGHAAADHRGADPAVDDLGIPHPAHIHANNLGLPGQLRDDARGHRDLEGRRGHFAHIQFHSYGGGRAARLRSQIPELADYVDAHPGLSIDVGQILFGDTTSMTAYGPRGQFLHGVTGWKWFNDDIEPEDRLRHPPDRVQAPEPRPRPPVGDRPRVVPAREGPRRVALSTDHPNGGSFLAYPQIVAS